MESLVNLHKMAEPVMILTCARSGSTLLRMILDAHPDLACPPETNLAKLCMQLRDMCATLESAQGPRIISGFATTSIKAVVDSTFGDYLRRRGKRRWCDKSLDASLVAEYFLELYGETKFICLYRHAMDVINSGIEASPWGLHGYGFDPYARASSSNMPAALASYWLDNTLNTIAFEERHPEVCIRVHYEKLVTSPGEEADRIFDFLGVSRVPDITRRALADQDALHKIGPGDHKIRSLTEIIDESAGSGIRVPPAMLAPNQLDLMNAALAKLGYTQVDENWIRSTYPPTLLALPQRDAAPDGELGPPTAGEDVADDHPSAAAFEALDAEIMSRARRALDQCALDQTPRERCGMVAYTMRAPRVVQAWTVDWQLGKVMSGMPAELDALDVDFVLTGELGTWRALLDGLQTMSSYLREGRLRLIAKELPPTQEGSHEIDPGLWPRRTSLMLAVGPGTGRRA